MNHEAVGGCGGGGDLVAVAQAAQKRLLHLDLRAPVLLQHNSNDSESRNQTTPSFDAGFRSRTTDYTSAKPRR